LLFAALQPERTQSLILGNTAARFSADEGYPGVSQLSGDAITKLIKGGGTWSDPYLHVMMPDASRDPEFLRWNTKTARLSMRPRDLRRHLSWVGLADVRDLLPSISAPTLVIHRENSAVVPIDQARYLAEHIPHAQLMIAPGADAAIWSPPADEILDSMAEFLTGARPNQEPDRALAAILFTDIVGSTEQAAALGDRRWRSLLESHDAVVCTIVDQHRGRLVKLTGDGALATFDGPGRAIQCALALRDALFTLGLRIRAGLHAGEVELRGDDIGGIGVHVAARVLDQARSDELLVSAAVPLLVAGSGIEFEDRGERDLKGLPGSWKLYAVEG
jgi:class 3 adenylate cyclase